MSTLKGQVAVVTGGGSGLGLAIARALAGQGAAVALMDMDRDASYEAASGIERDFSVPCLFMIGDVSSPQDTERSTREARDSLGAASILVNNAGIMVPRLAPTEQLEVDEFDRMMNVHVRGTFLMSRAVLPGMKEKRFGRIINLSSVLGMVGLPFRAAYTTAKTAIIGFTRGLAIEAARAGVTVNAIAPGYILTQTLRSRVESGLLDHDRFAERTPVGRWGRADEIARVAAFLADPASGYITGATIAVDGGFSIRGDPNDFIGERAVS